MKENTDLALASIRAEVAAFTKDWNDIFGIEGELLKSYNYCLGDIFSIHLII